MVVGTRPRSTGVGRGDAVNAGHRVEGVAGGLRLEAWAASRDACLCEAATALIESVVEVDDRVPGEPASLVIDGADDPAAVGTLLRELLGIVQMLGQAPVRVVLARTEDGRLAGTVDLAPLTAVRLRRPIPALGDHAIEHTADGWVAEATLLG